MGCPAKPAPAMDTDTDAADKIEQKQSRRLHQSVPAALDTNAEIVATNATERNKRRTKWAEPALAALDSEGEGVEADGSERRRRRHLTMSAPAVLQSETRRYV
jgi:hypothetical protein